jgi:3-carboxy-cis,cis-muconate cycloisomerase
MLTDTLFGSQFSDPESAAIFSDEQLVRSMLEVEAVLARVEAKLGIIPGEAAERISAMASPQHIDLAGLRASMESQGFPVIELVRQLRQAVGSDTASYVHRGATTQDIIDTARVVQIRASLSVIESQLDQTLNNLVKLADLHRRTLMAGRTHSQQALPIPFGLKVAAWIAPLCRQRERLGQCKGRILVIQFGGAAGTLASLGTRGSEVQTELAEAFDLAVPLMPWHTQRDGIVELAGWLSMLTGSLAKMAQDIILLSQSEVGELRESSDHSRGGSTTMPQKSNPISSEYIVGAARINASLLASLHQTMVQEHERGTHGWQVELALLPQMFVVTTSALRRALFLSEHLEVDVDRMRRNVAASNGLMMAEAVTSALSPLPGQQDARKVVTEAARVTASTGKHLVDVVREQTDATIDWTALKDESQYFGSADVFIDRVLAEVRAHQ